MTLPFRQQGGRIDPLQCQNPQEEAVDEDVIEEEKFPLLYNVHLPTQTPNPWVRRSFWLLATTCVVLWFTVAVYYFITDKAPVLATGTFHTISVVASKREKAVTTVADVNETTTAGPHGTVENNRSQWSTTGINHTADAGPNGTVKSNLSQRSAAGTNRTAVAGPNGTIESNLSQRGAAGANHTAVAGFNGTMGSNLSQRGATRTNHNAVAGPNGTIESNLSQGGAMGTNHTAVAVPNGTRENNLSQRSGMATNYTPGGLTSSVMLASGKSAKEQGTGGKGSVSNGNSIQDRGVGGKNTVRDDAHIPIVSVATVETRRNLSFFPVPGASSYEFRNLGVGRQWRSTITKVMLYSAWIRAQVLRDPDSLWILADGADVGFGGCTEDELLDHYINVVTASAGAQVVVGADNFIWPHVLRGQVNKYASLHAKRPAVLDAFGLKANLYAPYQEAGTYEYVNSGFLMGPASSLLEVLECMVTKGWIHSKHFDDQYALTECIFDMPTNITVDFTGSIVVDTMGFHHDLLYGYGGVVYNRATRRVQCFIHGNGGSFKMQTLEDMVTK